VSSECKEVMVIRERYLTTSGLTPRIVSRGVKRVENRSSGHPLGGGGALFGLGMITELKPCRTNASFVVAKLNQPYTP